MNPGKNGVSREWLVFIDFYARLPYYPSDKSPHDCPLIQYVLLSPWHLSPHIQMMTFRVSSDRSGKRKTTTTPPFLCTPSMDYRRSSLQSYCHLTIRNMYPRDKCGRYTGYYCCRSLILFVYRCRKVHAGLGIRLWRPIAELGWLKLLLQVQAPR